LCSIMDAQRRFDLTGQVAVVTGGARGIGKGIAVALAQHGADVAIVDILDTEPVIAQLRKLGRTAWSFQQDLAKTQQLGPLADDIWKTAGRIDILVNNAGVGYLDALNQITPQRWRQTMAVNVDAPFFLTQRVAERMIDAKIKGRIINTSSVNAMVAEAGLAHYNASKGALEMLTKSLAVELGPHGITSNSICPGIIETEISEDFELDPAFFDYYKEHIPMEQRFGKVEDCVGAVVLLASPAGRYISGQHIVIDGGSLADQVPRMQFMPPYRNTINQ